MASFTFGSFGDIITLTQIAYKVYDAIDSNGDLAKRLKVSKSDRETFLKACASVERAIKVGGPMSEDDAAAVKHVVAECKQFLAEFEKYLDKFTDPRQVVRFMRRVQSALFNKDESNHFQDRLRHHSMMLGLVLGPIQAKYTSLDLKAHITSSLEPWDQKPMQLQDALGRRYPVPLEVCSSFEGLLNFLQYAFKSDLSIYSAVQQQQFWLITPNNWDTQSWFVVQEEDWKSVARPGIRLGMSFYTQCQGGESGLQRKLKAPENPLKLLQSETNHNGVGVRTTSPMDHVADRALLEPADVPFTSSPYYNEEVLNEFVASVKFNDPMPPWALYNPDTKFQLLSIAASRPNGLNGSPGGSLYLRFGEAGNTAQNVSGSSERAHDSFGIFARRNSIDETTSSEERPSKEQGKGAKAGRDQMIVGMEFVDGFSFREQELHEQNE